ncbi:MAG: hypothetical protein EXR18_03150, partial [Flavobacteriaceae bacterium]|nr:hypothetical protein [Flavobacteriaceae bacterium]
MKKPLLLLLLFFVSLLNAQNVFNYGFTTTTATMTTTDGWSRVNQSILPSTTALWSVASYTSVTVSSTVNATPFQNQVYAVGAVCPIPNGQDGTPNSFALVNFASTTSTASSGATISNWLMTPSINVQNGDVVTFWTRKGTSGPTDYADHLELRMSSAATTVVPSSGPTDIGSFSTLCVSVNPNLATGFLYPKIWTVYSYTVSGLTAPTAVKFGFRYFVTDAGANGSNSDIIGIDTFSVTRTLSTSTESFFKNNLSIYPNPTDGVLNINSN